MSNKKRVLITGSSRGIGRALAIALSKDGYHILLHCSSAVEKAKEVQDIITKNGGTSELFCANLCDVNAAKKLIKEIGKIDILILNASLQYRTPWSEIDLEACYQQLNCNFVSSLLLIQGSVPHMKEKNWGRIITIGSVQEKKPHPDMLIYSASKCAQTNMVHSLSLQLATNGITVNNVAPGVINTDRNAQALSDPIYAKKVADSIPVGYYGQAEDCVGMVRLLCSEAGRYITGQNIFIDGGKSVQ